MAVSDRIKQSMTGGSWIRRMFDDGASLKQRYGADRVFDLSLGNPVMEPPPELRRELKRLAENPVAGMHRYMENAGYAETRAAVAARLSIDTGLKFTQNEIVMTCGAAGALNVVLKTILNPGEEVIVFAPYFPEYLNYIDNHGGVARILPTDDTFVPRLDLLEQSIGKQTKAVLLNSPNNPSGVVYSESFMRQLGALLDKKGKQIFLICDEPYRKIVYDGLKCPHVWHYYQQSIVVTSHSKDLGLPGERIGYVAVHPEYDERKELVDGFIYCNRVLGFVNAPALMQRLVSKLQAATVSIPEYQRKRDFLYDNLTGMGYSMLKPQGTFYMFPRTPVEDDVAFVRDLQQHLVLTVPGRGFGLPGHFRLAYCVDDSVLEGSLDGFRKAIKKLG